MGIFGALTTAVTGMKAQSFSLENISGNIANSQTTAFKRIDTSFQDLIPDTSATKQLSGNVTVMSRATNTVQGDIQTSSISTFMAINGDGFFVVQKPSSYSDNRPIFDGINLYTRRGDFQPNKDGYLVNGAGYFLEGIPVDPTTGNLVGSVPELLRFQNDFLPAQRTTEIDYRANLASYPLTPAHDVNIPGSELLNPADFIANPLAIPPQPAAITGQGAALAADADAVVTGTALPATLVNTGTFAINGTNIFMPAGLNRTQVRNAINGLHHVNAAAWVGPAVAGTINIGGTNVVFAGGEDLATTVSTINTALGLTNGLHAAIDSSTGGLIIRSYNNASFTITGPAATLTSLGFNGAGETSVSGTPAAGVTAVLDASNRLVLTGADADTAIAITGSATSLLTELGFQVGTTNPTNLLTQHAVAQGQTMVITIGASTTTLTFGSNDAAVPPEISTLADLATALATRLAPAGSGSIDAAGNITITAANMTDSITITGNADHRNFGMRTVSAQPSNQTVIANDLTAFINESIGGGAITCYDETGSPVNIQLRWAKTDSVTLGGSHVNNWNLFYQVNSLATGNQVAWQNVGTNFVFAANGQMSPAITNLTLANVTVDGISLGNVELNFGSGGLTQFSDPNGNVQVNQLQQNGFAAGSLQSVSVNDKGRVVGSYSNGRTIDLAQITLANFNGANSLKRLDGGAFEVTDESGPAVYGAPGKIVNSSLEGSNTDIADEFTKLIVTQQAYSANTRVISTTNEMVQDLINMLR